VLSSMLTRDIITSLLNTSWPPDRAIALEQAFEDGWVSATGNDWFANEQTSLWQGPDLYRVPPVFLNATESVSAGRIVLGPISMVGGAGIDPIRQKVVEDRALRLSTATVLSARFPYVSPEGRIVHATDANEQRITDWWTAASLTIPVPQR
jgi:hypothetical protein